MERNTRNDEASVMKYSCYTKKDGWFSLPHYEGGGEKSFKGMTTDALDRIRDNVGGQLTIKTRPDLLIVDDLQKDDGSDALEYYFGKSPIKKSITSVFGVDPAKKVVLQNFKTNYYNVR